MSGSREYFTSRWTFLLAALGMAVGAGNIWRFPRLAAQYGGSFLIPWAVFLFLWSIPLIMVEFSIGKKLRLGVIGAFNRGLGRSYTWMGWFVALCTVGIMFYYTVVCGWSLKFFVMSLDGSLFRLEYDSFWQSYTSGNIEPYIYALLSLLAGSLIISAGIRGGLEKAMKMMIPTLFILLVIAAVRAVTLDGAAEGLDYFFRVRQEDFLNYKVWLEALSQSAWSTGAGWGLILTYSTYVRQKEDVLVNSLFTGIGNNLASILAGLAVIPTVFALSATSEQALTALKAGNQGLTFIYIPQLFQKMPGGEYFAAFFFLALFIAALSSLLSMLELAVKLLLDYGIARKKSTAIVFVAGAVFSFPSAWSLGFFNNQDWVWGLGLLLSGFFFLFFTMRTGI